MVFHCQSLGSLFPCLTSNQKYWCGTSISSNQGEKTGGNAEFICSGTVKLRNEERNPQIVLQMKCYYPNSLNIHRKPNALISLPTSYREGHWGMWAQTDIHRYGAVSVSWFNKSSLEHSLYKFYVPFLLSKCWLKTHKPKFPLPLSFVLFFCPLPAPIFEF